MSNQRLFRSTVAGVFMLVCAGCVAKDASDDPDDASMSSCAAERHLVEKAVEAYYILEGAAPTDESQLVPNYLRKESAAMDVDAAGNVVAAPGSGCS